MLNPLDLTGKTILVTGASSGIGQATAILLSKLNAKVILVARDQVRLEETSRLIESNERFVEQFDLTSTSEISSWLNALSKKYGSLSGLVHCAGIRFTLPLKMTGADIVKATFATNVNSALALAQAFSQKNIYHENSSIVLISSVLGLVGNSGVSAYAASKGAIIALTKSLAVELAKNQIRVNCVVPGVVRTPLIAKLAANLTNEQQKEIEAAHLLGLGEPSDIANSIAFLLSDAARWITGSIMTVDGGYTVR